VNSATNEPAPVTGTVTILSGPVGSGKTTIAQKLVLSLPGPLSYIEGDRFWSFIAESANFDMKVNFRVIMRAATAAARQFAREGYDVIVDFSIPPGFMGAARKILKDVPLNYVMLLPSVSVCAERAATRPEGKIHDYTRFKFLYSLFESEERHVIRNDEVDPSAVAAEIKEGLKSGRFLVL